MVCPLRTHKGCFAAVCLHSSVMAHLIQGHHLVPFVLGAELLMKNNCLKTGFLNQNKTTMKKITKSPFSLPNQPCLASGEVILCFGSDNFFSESYALHRETSFTYAIKYCFPEHKWPHRACCQHIPARFLQEFSRIISFGTVAQ